MYWLVSLTICETQRCVVLTVNVWFWLCVIMLFPSALWNHAQLGGGSDAERLMSTLAYGWVEHCSDIASCGPTSFPYKYPCVFDLFNELFMN